MTFTGIIEGAIGTMLGIGLISAGIPLGTERTCIGMRMSGKIGANYEGISTAAQIRHGLTVNMRPCAGTIGICGNIKAV